MKGQVAFEAMSDLDDIFIVEAAEVLGLDEKRKASAGRARRERREGVLSRFFDSSWGVALLCAVVSLGVLAAIIRAGNQPPVPEPIGTDEPTDTDGVTEEPVPEVYREIITLYAKMVELCPDYDDQKAAEGFYTDSLGPKDEDERAMIDTLLAAVYLNYPGRTKADKNSPHYLLSCGYSVKDLNGDGTEELVLLTDDYRISAIFSVSAEDERPVLLDSFRERRSGWIDSEGLLHVTCNNGAYYSSYTVYRIADGGTSLKLVIEFGGDGLAGTDGVLVKQYYKQEDGERVLIQEDEYHRLADRYVYYDGVTGHAVTARYSGLLFTPLFTREDIPYLSKSEAMEIASEHWGIRTGDVDPDNGFLYRIDSQGTVQAPDGRIVYNIFLRWLVELPDGSHYSTVENIWVDAVTGAVREAEIAK